MLLDPDMQVPRKDRTIPIMEVPVRRIIVGLIVQILDKRLIIGLTKMGAIGDIRIIPIEVELFRRCDYTV